MKPIKLTLLLLITISLKLNAQWEVQLDVNYYTLLDRIHFIDKNNGWAIGSSIIAAGPYFYTTNGGENWYIYDNETYGYDIVFVNQDTGFIAADYGIIRKTTNGGQTWTDIQTPATVSVMRLFFVDENTGWATLNNQTDNFQLLHTSDGGDNWETQQVFTFNTSSLRSIHFINESIGYGGGVL